MSTTTITDNISDARPCQVKPGQFYKDIGDAEGAIYIVTQAVGTRSAPYLLINITSGIAYCPSSNLIAGIFGGDADDFVLINNVEIIIS